MDEQVAALKERAAEVQKEVDCAAFNFCLPFHVSLKMSFEVADDVASEVMDRVEDYLAGLSPFAAKVDGIRMENTIVWLKLAPHARLAALHDDLNRLLLAEYGVGLHPYDEDYLFHVTLFMDEDEGKIKTAFDEIADCPYPFALTFDRYLIGTSPSGALGTYRVVRRISV